VSQCPGPSGPALSRGRGRCGHGGEEHALTLRDLRVAEVAAQDLHIGNNGLSPTAPAEDLFKYEGRLTDPARFTSRTCSTNAGLSARWASNARASSDGCSIPDIHQSGGAIGGINQATRCRDVG
jgi:hypothetical protein